MRVRTERVELRMSPAEKGLLEALRPVVRGMRGLRAVPSQSDTVMALAGVLARAVGARKVYATAEVREAVRQAWDGIIAERATVGAFALGDWELADRRPQGGA